MAEAKCCALIYDFDLTLTEKHQQMAVLEKYAAGVQEKYNLNIDHYFHRPGASANMCIWMSSFIDDARDIFPNLSNEALEKDFAPQIPLAPGLPRWFERINHSGRTFHLDLSHHVISGGCMPLIKGTAIAPYLSSIYACEFLEKEGKIDSIGKVVDPYTKSKWIKNICKGKEKDLHSDLTLDEYFINYENVILFGDGETDRDALNFIRERGGHTVGVYKKDDRQKFEKAKQALDGKVHFLVPRDYTKDSPLEDTVQKILWRIQSRKCKYYYTLVHCLPLGHIADEGLQEMTKNHLASCQDCHYRSLPTELVQPK